MTRLPLPSAAAATAPPDPIPPEFGSQSTLTKDIQAGDNQFDVNIPAAAKRW